MSDRTDSEAESFDAFFRSMKTPLLAMAYVLTGSLPTAQDLTQEALLRTWTRWSRIEKYDDPQAWTRRVLHNLIMNHKRSDKVRRTAVEQPRSSPPPDEIHLVLAEALRSLPENQMRAILLHDGAGMSVRDVAIQMLVPEGTVKSWLSRGRASAAHALNASSTPPKEDHAQR